MVRKLIVVGVLSATALGLLAEARAQQAAPTTVTPPPIKGRQYVPPYYVFSPDIPHDAVTQDLPAIGLQPFVDNLAWGTFIAVNWPAPNPVVQRGVPDRQNVIGGLVTQGEGGKTTMPTGPVVWETFKDSDEIYLNPPLPPTPFDTPETIPPQCQALAAAGGPLPTRTLNRTAKIGEVLRGVEQVDGNRLVDQNGQNVWYEVKLNRVYYDYVVRNRFYDSRWQQGRNIEFPSSSNDTAQAAPVKIKAAWKVMGLLGSKQPDDLTKFYTTDAFVIDPSTGQCERKLLGLVGLHVVFKTKQLPQWVWATFEHVDNAPDLNTTVPSKAYNFYNPSCMSCLINTPPPKDNPTMPTQVMRVIPVSSDAAGSNTAFKNGFITLRPDNVWQNYMLVDAMWSPSREHIGVPQQPKFLANTTLETYMQAQTQPYGCINCHGMYAGSTDLDFQLTNAYPRNGVGAVQLMKIPGVLPGSKAP